MARKKRPKINLTPNIQPQSGEMDRLFATDDDAEQASGLQLLAVRLDAIEPDPAQPRRTFPEESLQELSESIRQDGVIQPIEVTEISPNRYLIVHGERRWRAAQMAGLETIPAVVRRRNYDDTTRFVRQLVENIQREDLNDIDRAAGLLRLRDLMQEELDKAHEENIPSDEPWGKKITWSKVGKRLGYSRQRIHQLIKLLDLPGEIKTAVREGVLTERDTRVYQGLKPSQQRALHKARLAGDLNAKEVKQVARMLKENPDQTVYQTIREMRRPLPEVESESEPAFDPSLDQDERSLEAVAEGEERRPSAPESSPYLEAETLPDLAPGQMKITNVKRLTYVRQHLARIQSQGMGQKERQEVIRLLRLVAQDIGSLLTALENQ